MQSQALLPDIQAAVAKITAQYQALVAGKTLTWQSVVTLIGSATDSIVDVYRNYAAGGAEDWKTDIINTLGVLYDTVIAPIEVKELPAFIAPTVVAALRQFALAAASSLYDVIAAKITTKPVSPTVPPIPGGGTFAVPHAQRVSHFEAKALIPASLAAACA
jgi:hypothetical protein